MYNIYKFQEIQRTFLSSLFTFHFSLHFTINFGESYLVLRQRRPACGLGLRQLGLSVCRRWRSLASRYGFWGRRLWHRTCKTSRGWLEHRTCKTSPGWLPGARLWHRTCKTSPGWLWGRRLWHRTCKTSPGWLLSC